MIEPGVEGLKAAHPRLADRVPSRREPRRGHHGHRRHGDRPTRPGRARISGEFMGTPADREDEERRPHRQCQSAVWTARSWRARAEARTRPASRRRWRDGASKQQLQPAAAPARPRLSGAWRGSRRKEATETATASEITSPTEYMVQDQFAATRRGRPSTGQHRRPSVESAGHRRRRPQPSCLGALKARRGPGSSPRTSRWWSIPGRPVRVRGHRRRGRHRLRPRVISRGTHPRARSSGSRPTNKRVHWTGGRGSSASRTG